MGGDNVQISVRMSNIESVYNTYEQCCTVPNFKCLRRFLNPRGSYVSDIASARRPITAPFVTASRRSENYRLRHEHFWLICSVYI